MSEASEQWLPCPGFSHWYEVSSLGRVRSNVRGGRILAQCKDRDGYPYVGMNKDGKRSLRAVHRLVCRAFQGEQPDQERNEVAHMDGDRTNARADNLRWVSKSENISHRRLHGTWPSGENHPLSILRDAQVLAIRKMQGQGTARSIAEKFGVSRHTIQDIWSGSRWKHLLPHSHGETQ